MNWITQHTDVILAGLVFITSFVAYRVGVEVGYSEGLEDGHANASR